MTIPAQTWLNIYDISGNLKTRIFEYALDECTIRSNTFGILKLRIHQDAVGCDQLVKRYWIEIYRNGDTVWSGVICHMRKSFDENGDPTRYYEVVARCFNWLPYWRVIVPPSGQDYLIKSGAKVDDAVKYMVREQMETGHVDDANRAISGFSVEADDTEHGDTKTLAARYQDNLGSLLEKWASAYNFDWWVEADCPNATFVLRTKVPRRGSDKSASVVFTVNRHNLKALEYYEDDLDTKSLVYAGGWGQGQHQDINKVYDGSEPTGWDRREVYIEATNAETADEVDMVGHAWLDANGSVREGVTFELTGAEADNWPDDFDIGDIVTIYDSDFGADVAAEIKVVNFAIDEDGNERIRLTVGEPEPSAWELEKRQRPEQAREHLNPQHEHDGGAGGPNIPVANVTPEPYHPANGGTPNVPAPGDLDPPAATNTHTHSFSASVTGTSAAGSSHSHSFSASVTGTSAAGSSHTHSFSANVTGTSAAENSHTHSFSASVTGETGAESNHAHTATGLTLTGTSGGLATGDVGEHTHEAGTYETYGNTGGNGQHTHDAQGSLAISGTTGGGSLHDHGSGLFAVSGTSGAEAAHTHGAGTFAVSGTTGGESSHTHGPDSFAVSGTTGQPG